MKKLLKYASVLSLILLGLTACSKSIIVEIAKQELCDKESWKEIKGSKKDTKETKDSIVGNNEARKQWCKK